MNKPRASKYIFWTTAIFLILPLLVLLFYSFNESRSFTWTGFSFIWYEKLFNESAQLWQAVNNSLIVALVSSLIATVIGSLGAIAINWYKFFFKPYATALSFLPLVLPEIVLGVSILVFFNMIGLPLGMVSVIIANSLIVALVSSLIATVIGSLGAIAINWYKFFFKPYATALSFLPLVLPEIVLGVSILVFFNMIGLPLGMVSVIIAHTTFTLPFVLLMVMARLSEFDFSIIEASRDLGATELQTLLRVIIPISMPGIISGFLTAFTLSLEDFVVTLFVAGPGSSTLPLYIFSAIRFGVTPTINAFSVLLIAVTVLLAVSVHRLFKYLIKA